MGSGRLEAFSDAVFAIIITIMVLELKVPEGPNADDLFRLLPAFLSYVLSFVYLGIYWNNHHHLLNTCTSVTAATLWANLHLLFWLSLVPFATGWIGQNQLASLPTAFYGVVLLMAGCAYYLLEQAIIRAQGPASILEKAVGQDRKAKLSLLLYATAIVASGRWAWLSDTIWLIPDRRVEHAVRATSQVTKPGYDLNKAGSQRAVGGVRQCNARK
jgi:TMEM175 potassium channel family protein